MLGLLALWVEICSPGVRSLSVLGMWCEGAVPPPGAAGRLEVYMPAVLEVEIGSTARLECSFSIPGNVSFTSVEWFYVSAVGLGGRRGAVSRALHHVRPQVNHGHSNRVRLCVITASGARIDETEYSERLSVGEDKALSISKVTRQDNARTFICRVGADGQGVGENHTELSTYSEWCGDGDPVLFLCIILTRGMASCRDPRAPRDRAQLCRHPCAEQ